MAAVSGDARRALEICRSAAELADYRIKQLSSPDSASEGTKYFILAFFIVEVVSLT